MHADKCEHKKDFLARPRLSRGYRRARAGLFPSWKKPNKKMVRIRKKAQKKMRKEKPMIFLRWRKVKAVAAEQTSVGRNLRSISEQGPSNLTEQTKRWPPWVIFRKKGEGHRGRGRGRASGKGTTERDGVNR